MESIRLDVNVAFNNKFKRKLWRDKMKVKTTIIATMLMIIILCPAIFASILEPNQLPYVCVSDSKTAIAIAEIVLKGIDPSFEPEQYQVTVINFLYEDFWIVIYSLKNELDERTEYSHSVIDSTGYTGPHIKIRKSDAQIVEIAF